MNIVVCIKQVPDIIDVRIDDKTKNLQREGIASIINPYDLSAMKLALKLKEQTNGTVTALSMGPKQATAELEKCLKLGADRAVLVCDRKLAGSDTLATSYALSKTIEGMNADIILCGAEAIDSCTAQVGPGIAANLGIPFITNIVDASFEGGKLQAYRNTSENIEHYELLSKALLCVLKGKSVEIPDADVKTEIEILDAASLDEKRIGSAGSPTRVVDIKYSNSRPVSYVDVPDELNSEERMDYIIAGGIKIKDNPLIRGTGTELANRLYEMIGR